MELKNLVEGIKDGSYQVLGEVYEKYRNECIQWLASKYNCDPDQAKDIYQHAIIILYENVTQNKLTRLNSNIKTYVFAIAKNKMREYLREKNKMVNIGSDSDDINMFQEDETNYSSQEDLLKLRKGLGQLGEPCQTLMKMFYYQKLQMSEIKLALNYKTEASAKNQKYKCLLRLRRIYRDLGSDMKKVS